jgi:ABC-2 type transport system ATP-binding protein
MNFGTTAALEGLAFCVAEGEIFGFLGPSGAGKTTTIKLLTKQLQPTSGSIEVLGDNVAKIKRTDYQRIGVLSDTSGVYERLSVWENLQLFAAVKGVDHKAIEGILDALELTQHKQKKAKVLSRGMRQRLTLAQALLHKPPLLFLDEPTASLDPATTASIHKLLKRMNAEGTTIFLTTHDMAEADKLCHRVAFLDRGHIVEMGTPGDLKIQYGKNRVEILCGEGQRFSDEKTSEGVMRLAQKAKGMEILSIHSQEPSLEEIFLQVTGRTLV